MARISNWIAIDNDKISITDAHHRAVKQQIQNCGYSHPENCPVQLYQNLLCAHVWLEWMTQEGDLMPRQLFSERDQFVLLHFISGVPFQLGRDRLVLIPTIDLDPELSVPQEWIDTPDWVADYYLSVQLDLEENWLKIIGYATHQQLKQKGTFVEGDRSYCLPDHALQETTGLWIARTLAPHPRTAVTPLEALTPAIAKQLLQTLQTANSISLRYCLPFPQWAALMSDRVWREQLFQQLSGSQFAQRSQPSRQAGRTIRERLNPGMFEWAGAGRTKGRIQDDSTVIEVIESGEAIDLKEGKTRVEMALGGATVRLDIVCELAQPNPESISELRVRIDTRLIQWSNLPELVQFQILYSEDCDPLEREAQGSMIADGNFALPQLLGMPGEQFRLIVTLAEESKTVVFKL